MQAFKTIGLLGQPSNEQQADSVATLIEVIHGRGREIVLSKGIAEVLGDHRWRVAARSQLGALCDLVVVVGGDGSMLGAARDLADHDVALLGVNRGKLGFLTDIKPEEVTAKVGAVLDGEYILDPRFLLDVVVKRDGQIIAEGDALNDVVINSGGSARMIYFDLYIDDEYVYSQDSDGLIVSTPTGSTAYALSGGGPIMHPDLDAVVLVPMFPHTLSARPVVVGGNSMVKVVVGNCHPYVSCDGQVNLNTAPGDEVFIHKKPHRLKLIHPRDHSFFAACRDKLGWSSRLAAAT